VYGSGETYELTFAPGGALNRLDIRGPSSGHVHLLGATGRSLYVASVASAVGSIIVDGIRTDGTPASGNGDVVISAGGGLARDGANRMRAVASPSAAAQDLRLSDVRAAMGSVHAMATGKIDVLGPVTSVSNDVVMSAVGDLQLAAAPQGSAPTVAGSGTVALSTGARFLNNRGPDAISASHWVVYAATPTGNIYGGLDSGNTALWGAGIESRAPGAISGNRYVFRSPATLTFTSLDAEKTFGEGATAALSYSVAGYQEGVPGAFHDDTATTAFSGTPSLTSAGAPASATPEGGPYLIEISQGSLASATGYDFAFSSTGTLTVNPAADVTPPSLSVTCPARVYLNASAVARIVASDAGSGLRSDPSGTVAMDTSTVGPSTLVVTATDNAGNTTKESCTTQVVYRFGGFQQPINPDGSSVFKLGSTVATKIVLTDVNGTPVAGAVATLQVSKLTDNVEGNSLQATSTAAATSGSQFRYDPEAQQYVFNLGTKPLSAGTWRLTASLDDGTIHTVQISLR
ncbi:MAG TPA: PxKF domain-containing protein, partial [Acidimicrobiales bacterium]|nr:PxKF domain-containing protein [Acidimicrobiales bacterium]